MIGTSERPLVSRSRIARTADRIEGDARAGLTAMAFDLKPPFAPLRHCPIGATAAQARHNPPSGSTVLRLQRGRQADRFLRGFARALSAYLRARICGIDRTNFAATP